MEYIVLRDASIIFILALIIVSIFHRLKMPAIIGFLITGILIGPHFFGLIPLIKEVEMLAEIGVILLLFTIGLESSPKDLLNSKKITLIGGSLQAIATIVLAFFVAKQFAFTNSESILIGFIISLSSTAIVIKLFQEKNETRTPYGRAALGILVFQDLIAIPMILFIPFLAGHSDALSGSVISFIIKALAITLITLWAASFLVPKLLYHVAKTRSQELFLMAVLLICFAVAYITNASGLSLALGAFLAGLVISESEYGSQALGNVLPFRDVFTSIFFVSIGMLLDAHIIFKYPLSVAAVTLGIILLKALVIIVIVILLGMPLRIAFLLGFSLSQIGEFSFILSKAGLESGIITDSTYQIILAASILTMIATPIVMNGARPLSYMLTRIKVLKRFNAKISEKEEKTLKDHALIIGFGSSGKNVASAAKIAKIKYAIIEMNTETVKNEKKNKVPIFYGDATNSEVLHQGSIENAKVAIISINDFAATRRIVKLVRKMNPDIYVIVRAQFTSEIKALSTLGADEVISEEFESSIEIFSRVLKKYNIKEEKINTLVKKIRADGYRMLNKKVKNKIFKRDL